MKDINSFGHPNPLQYGQWWDFCEQPPTQTVVLNTVTAGANADDDVSATLIGIIPQAARLVAGYVAVSAQSTGLAAGDLSTWVVSVGGTTAFTLARSTVLEADTPVSLGTLAITDVSAGSAVKLAITNGTNADLNSAVCQTALVIADAKNYPAAGLTVVASDGGTVTVSDGVKGVCAISPGAADNGEIYLAAELENVKLLANKVFVGEAFIQFTESNTDDANVVFSFTNAVAANELVDDGAGPKATGDYIAIWKVDGGTKWYCGCQSNGTATPTTDTISTVTAGGSSYQRLKIKVSCETSTRAIAEFEVDGQNIGTIHFSYASATEMQLCLGVKNGSASAETLNVDYFGYEVLR